jgi:putative transcriptional regulator
MLALNRTSLRAVLATVAAAAALTGPAALQAQGVQNGSLLVASTELKDPNFSHTVILVLQHDDRATLGVVINRITSLAPANVFPELQTDLGTYMGTLYRGGPVNASQVLFLVRGLAAAAAQGPEIVDKVFLSGDPESLGDIARLAEGPDDLRVYAGHAIWGAGQLAREISQGAWRVVPGTADLVFTAEPTKLWEQLGAGADGVVVDSGSAAGSVVVDTRIRP